MRRPDVIGHAADPSSPPATILGQTGRLFSEKIPQARQLDDMFRRQDCADKIRLRHGVNFVQMTLRFGLQHKFPDALVEGAFNDHVGSRAERGANALLFE